MNYEKILIEMLSRIQTLEDEVRELSSRLDAAAAEEPGGEHGETRVSTGDIRVYIEQRKQAARLSGEDALTLRASEIHGAMKLSKRYPMVCNAMRQCMEPGDTVIHETASGYSSSLEIRYQLRGAASAD